jgi:hypothetical protein
MMFVVRAGADNEPTISAKMKIPAWETQRRIEIEEEQGEKVSERRVVRKTPDTGQV